MAFQITLQTLNMDLRFLKGIHTGLLSSNLLQCTKKVWYNRHERSTGFRYPDEWSVIQRLYWQQSLLANNGLQNTAIDLSESSISDGVIRVNSQLKGTNLPGALEEGTKKF